MENSCADCGVSDTHVNTATSAAISDADPFRAVVAAPVRRTRHGHGGVMASENEEM
ncbi:hypothetical protein GCM10017600_50660 [Streptosporangium carneum]|uniref:Uncharacterized protein n=1 Tax=Streptosporangium carneum TaxID=47481 RepID=A0A9W6I643_9ACTN|nr:hypothetical protein GCM10017600_50660 [Streptosporangium carneum]